TIPAIFAGAERPSWRYAGPAGDLRTSSTAPTACMTSTAMTRPSGSVLAPNTSPNAGIAHAAAMPARNPASIPTPPRVGVATVWERRPPGACTRLRRSATLRHRPVATRVAIAETAKTTPWAAWPLTATRGGSPGQFLLLDRADLVDPTLVPATFERQIGRAHV